VIFSLGISISLITSMDTWSLHNFLWQSNSHVYEAKFLHDAIWQCTCIACLAKSPKDIVFPFRILLTVLSLLLLFLNLSLFWNYISTDRLLSFSILESLPTIGHPPGPPLLISWVVVIPSYSEIFRSDCVFS